MSPFRFDFRPNPFEPESAARLRWPGRYNSAAHVFLAERTIVSREGRVRTLNEIALQIWSGDRILHEQFYYDPGQLR
jgi:hypothetical protein